MLETGSEVEQMVRVAERFMRAANCYVERIYDETSADETSAMLEESERALQKAMALLQEARRRVG
jgi:hypothetical protein